MFNEKLNNLLEREGDKLCFKVNLQEELTLLKELLDNYELLKFNKKYPYYNVRFKKLGGRWLVYVADWAVADAGVGFGFYLVKDWEQLINPLDKIINEIRKEVL